MSLDSNSILLLKGLFDRCNKNGSESDSDDDRGTASSDAPNLPRKGDIKKTLENPLLKTVEGQSEVKIESYEQFEEVMAKDAELIENLKTPEYSVVFKQAVAPEDVFLQFSGKTPATFSCEDMIMKIELPEETVGIDQMNLVVEENMVKLKTKIYRLEVQLSQRIEKKQSKAEYDAESKQLILTMRLNRGKFGFGF